MPRGWAVYDLLPNARNRRALDVSALSAREGELPFGPDNPREKPLMQNHSNAHSAGGSRRNWLKTASLAGAAAALAPATTLAQTLGAKRTEQDLQGAGFYRLKLGTATVTVLSDGAFTMNPVHPTFAVNATQEQVEKALADAFIPYDQATVQVNALLIQTPRDTVLIDTGCGSAFGPTTGKLVENLARTGVRAKDITAVILTHLHADHMAGLFDDHGEPNFPNAQFIVHNDEHAFWSADNPDFSASALPADMRAAFVAGAKRTLSLEDFTRVEGETEVRPGITIIPAHGHTPGHIALMIDGGGTNQLLYISDTLHQPAIQLPHPEFYVAFDVHPDRAVKSRKRILDRVAADKMLVSGSHLPFPSVGRIGHHADGYCWMPAPWRW